MTNDLFILPTEVTLVNYRAYTPYPLVGPTVTGQVGPPRHP